MSIEEEFPAAYFGSLPPYAELAETYNTLRTRAIQLEKAMVRIVEIYDTDGDVYHDIEAMNETALKALKQNNE